MPPFLKSKTLGDLKVHLMDNMVHQMDTNPNEVPDEGVSVLNGDSLHANEIRKNTSFFINKTKKN